MTRTRSPTRGIVDGPRCAFARAAPTTEIPIAIVIVALRIPDITPPPAPRAGLRTRSPFPDVRSDVTLRCPRAALLVRRRGDPIESALPRGDHIRCLRLRANPG